MVVGGGRIQPLQKGEMRNSINVQAQEPPVLAVSLPASHCFPSRR